MGRLDRWAKGGIVAGILTVALGGAFFVTAYRAKTTPSTPTAAAGDPASNATPNGAGCRPPESGAEQSARIMPIVAKQFDLSESQRREAGAIMAARFDAVRELHKDRPAGSHEEVLRAALTIDQEARKKMEALFGDVRGREVYAAYFRADAKDKVFASKEEAMSARAAAR